jgi:hypothetical protein
MYLFKCPILGLLFGIIKQLLPWMDCKRKRKTFKSLEIFTFWSFSVEFITEIITDRGNQSTYYWMLSSQSIQRKKKHKNWMNSWENIVIHWSCRTLSMCKILILCYCLIMHIPPTILLFLVIFEPKRCHYPFENMRLEQTCIKVNNILLFVLVCY